MPQNMQERLLSLIAGSRLNSEIVGEPVKGVEPITYGLQIHMMPSCTVVIGL